MIELHLMGYTSDLRYLVLDLDPEGERGRYRLVVDADLLLTLDELRDLRAQAGMDVGIPYEQLEERLGIVLDRSGSAPAERSPTEIEAPRAGSVDDRARPDEPVTARPPTSQPPPTPEVDDGHPPTFRLIDEPEGADVPEQPDEPLVPEEPEQPEQPEEPEQPDEPEQPEETDEPHEAAGRSGGPQERQEPEDVAPDDTGEREAADEPHDTDEPGDVGDTDDTDEAGRREEPDAAAASAASHRDLATPGRDSELSPAQIQARLRAGHRPESVAEEAGTDVAWVERWLPPILTERAQVLQEGQAMHLERPRKGRSGAPLGEAVAANLRRRHLDPEEDAEWSVKRRANGRWSINVRYRYRNKTRSATWALDREEGELTPSSKAARDLGWVDRP